MNPRRKRFTEYYNATGNMTEAAVKAGYSKKTAYSQGNRLLKNAEVQEYLHQLQDAEKEKRILDASSRKVLLSEIAQDDMQDANARIKAIDTLNKMTGEYITKAVIGKKEEELPKLLEALGSDTD